MGGAHRLDLDFRKIRQGLDGVQSERLQDRAPCLIVEVRIVGIHSLDKLRLENVGVGERHATDVDVLEHHGSLNVHLLIIRLRKRLQRHLSEIEEDAVAKQFENALGIQPHRIVLGHRQPFLKGVSYAVGIKNLFPSRLLPPARE